MSLPDGIRFFVLPIVIGFISTLVSFAFRWYGDKLEKSKANRERQIKESTELCRKIIDASDTLFSHINHDVWYAAWRRALPRGFHEDLMEADKAAWSAFNQSLDAWRTTVICNDTELMIYFGEKGIEVLLFRVINGLFEEAATELWNTFYSHKEGSIILSKSGGGDSFTQKRDRDLTEEDQKLSRDKFDAILEMIRTKIAMLSITMLKCLQAQFVGNLRNMAPPPEELKQMMDKLMKEQTEAPKKSTSSGQPKKTHLDLVN